MPSSTATNFLHEKFLNLLLRGTAFGTVPANIYVGFFTTTPQLDGTGGTEVSTSGTAYAREAIASDTGWAGPSGTNREYSNAADITYAVPTANWGTIVGAGLFDASTGGNLLYVAPLTTPKVVNNGDGAPRILAGQLRIARATC